MVVNDDVLDAPQFLVNRVADASFAFTLIIKVDGSVEFGAFGDVTHQALAYVGAELLHMATADTVFDTEEPGANTSEQS